MADIVVCGGSVIGSATAMMLAADGHDVVVLEGDDRAAPERAADAWDGWDRGGVPQFHQPHNLFPRVRQVLDAELPGMTGALVDAGCRWVDLVEVLPPSIDDQAPRPDDDRFRSVTGCRPVVEAVLASAAAAHPGVTVRRGTRVAGLRAGPQALAGVPHVAGVELASGEVLPADLVVDATGRRTKLAAWLGALGAVAPLVESEDRGFVYHTRYFAGPELPFTFGPPLMPFGSSSLLTLAGDNDTWSVTVFGASADPVLKRLRDPDAWTRVVGACPLQAHWLDGRALGGIESMAGILDRYRRYVVDGRPVATGVVAVGDAWACTNPSAGRGISVGLAHAQRLRWVVAEALAEPAALVARFDELTERDLAPYVRVQVRTDRSRMAEMEAHRHGRPAPPGDPDAVAFVRAMALDADVFRAFMETVGCLASADEVLARPAIRARVDELGGGDGEVPPFPGPTRTELEALAS